MRSRTIELSFVALVLMPFLLVSPAWATQKQRTIIIALDQSGSMLRSDPDRLRVEAAGLLAATENPNDQVGVIAFGDSARWLQKPMERNRFDFSLLDKIGSSDAHTAFAPVLRSVEDYLVGQPASFFQDNDISLVLLTDGRSDPANRLADEDRSQALSIASENAWRLKVYTIGLGNDLDLDFLDRLARSSNGFSIHAASASDLPEAFLRVAARTAALPVYIRSSSVQNLTWTGKPDRVVVVFTGEHADSLQLPGHVLYRSSHVAVAEEDAGAGKADLSWSGRGLAFLCVQEPLRLSADGEFPSALLTDAPRPIALSLTSSHGPVKSAFFLQSANAHLELAGRDSEIVPLSQQADPSRFAGELQARSAGAFRARAYLDSPYGEVETYLGDVKAVVMPVEIPQQVSAGVFDPLPRDWFQKKLTIRSLLPVGAVNLQFTPQGSSDGPADRMSNSLQVSAGQSSKFNMMLEGDPGQVHVVDYIASWNDGTTQVARHGALRVVTRQMTVGELIRNKWPWAGAILLFLCAFGTAVWSFWPRPLQADLIVRQNGTQVLRLRLPAQLRTRMLHVSEGQVGNSAGSSRAVIAGPQSRELLSLQSTRRRGRWTIVARPRAAHAPAPQVQKSAEIDLRSIHVPVFATEDGTIQINVLYS
ncbi:MAG: vWA domain-containing protein [Acidobacteriaceae bacterium]